MKPAVFAFKLMVNCVAVIPETQIDVVPPGTPFEVGVMLMPARFGVTLRPWLTTAVVTLPAKLAVPVPTVLQPTGLPVMKMSVCADELKNGPLALPSNTPPLTLILLGSAPEI